MIGLQAIKEPVSAGTHFVGFVAAVVGFAVMLSAASGETPVVASLSVYGASLVALFLASSVYHALKVSDRATAWLRRLDHSAIALMIAGTYVPPLVLLLEGPWRVSMLSAMGALTVVALLLKLLWIECPAWLGVGVYLAMGWAVVVPAHLIFPQLTSLQLTALLTGGIFYTVGAVIYALRRPDPWPGVFGFHEIWHLFVLCGAGAHFAFIWLVAVGGDAGR